MSDGKSGGGKQEANGLLGISEDAGLNLVYIYIIIKVMYKYMVACT